MDENKWILMAPSPADWWFLNCWGQASWFQLKILADDFPLGGFLAMENPAFKEMSFLYGLPPVIILILDWDSLWKKPAFLGYPSFMEPPLLEIFIDVYRWVLPATSNVRGFPMLDSQGRKRQASSKKPSNGRSSSCLSSSRSLAFGSFLVVNHPVERQGFMVVS